MLAELSANTRSQKTASDGYRSNEAAGRRFEIRTVLRGSLPMTSALLYDSQRLVSSEKMTKKRLNGWKIVFFARRHLEKRAAKAANA